ncbi:hypothetical protein Y032_0445g1584 [Ancylostoma ceylanicum]|uniref:Cystatin domain-containing protein n=1 Tax=Ancylostoma ceylanicum TaxID=53326 RepID=A0A016WYL5_9BILA|nr:hypothetical protein Y032_0445g1584 [Ancylostoma ceylanicum]
MPNFVSVIAVFTFTLFAVNAMMTGGIMDQDPKDPEWMTKAWKAAKSLNEGASNAGPHIMIPIKVLKAQTQVVAGTIYTFEILFGESECKKGLYKVSLLEKPWQNYEQFNVEKLRDVSAGEEL